MVFFPLVVSPTLFKILNEDQAGQILRSFFPKYYMYGITLSLIGLVCSFYEENYIAIYLFIFLSVTFIFSREFLMPRINNARDNFNKSGKFSKIQFKKLHSISVIINVFQLILCICLVLNLIVFNFNLMVS